MSKIRFQVCAAAGRLSCSASGQMTPHRHVHFHSFIHACVCAPFETPPHVAPCAQVVYASGEDPEYPADELNLHRWVGGL